MAAVRPNQDSTWDLRRWMSFATAGEIKLLFLEFQPAGVTFQQKLKKQLWGARNFVVKDPEGNLLLFAGPAN